MTAPDLPLRDVLDNVLDFVCVADPEGAILDVNRPALEVSGLERPDLVGKSLADLPLWAHAPELRDRILRAVERAADGHSSRFDATAVFADDRRLAVEVLVRPIHAADARVQYLVVSAVDIGARLQAETRQAESDRRYRTLFNSTDEGFCLIEMLFDERERPVDYRFLELNPRFQEQTGLVDAEGRTARELVPDLEWHWFETYGRVALTGESTRFEDGSREMGRWFDVYAFRIGDDDSRTVGILFKDITDRKLAELELAALNRDLEERVQERTRQVQELAAELTLAEAKERARLAQVLHDDLQQQLYALQFALHDARRAQDPEVASHLLEEVEQRARDAISVSRRTTANLSPPVLRGDGLVEALQWLGSDMRSRYGLEVDVRAPGGLTVPNEAIRVLLFELVRELLFNVVKHAEAPAAVVTMREADDWLELTVLDEGRGFEPVGTQEGADDGTTGTGLGLSGIGRRLRLFGGTMHVTSQIDEGTRVTLNMPIDSLTG